MSMRRIAEVGALAAALTACAGPSVGGQATPPDRPPPSQPNLYEVPTDRMPDAGSQEAQEVAWIQVDGYASVEVEPDRAAVAFALETRADEAAEASGANADAMDAVLSAIRDAGFVGLELRTFGYSLRPEYAVTNNQRTREIVAYVASNNVRATVHNAVAVGRVIDTAIGAGANRVAGISFFASDTEDARNEAMAQAVRDATTEARVIAEALGYELGPPLEINGGAQRPSPGPMLAQARAFEQAAPTPIEVGTQTVTANVSIRFALGPRMGG